MILNISGRCDIVAFHTEWLMKRYRDGFVDVRNPFYPKSVSRIRFENVKAIVFCTKNPLPILEYLKEFHHPMLFQVTLTPYKKEIEPNVIDKTKIIEGIKAVSKQIGKEFVSVRYDPIFLSEEYDVDYHIKAFERMCSLLEGATNQIITSFIDEYKNVQKNQSILKLKEFKEEDYKRIGESFSAIATRYGMTVQTCFEERTLTEYGFIKAECISKEVAFQLTGKKYKSWVARKCGCAEMVDIGVYNSCAHFCKYCYANYDEKMVLNNRKKHNPDSSLLIGELTDDDIIKERLK